MSESRNWLTAPAHESTDLQPRHAAAFAAGLILMLAAVIIVSLWIFHDFSHSYVAARGSFLLSDLQALPEPRLQVFPQADLEQLRRSNREALETYEWVDRQGKTVRIPIERAMEIISERGMPDFTARGSK